jgi:hypothetical protein
MLRNWMLGLAFASLAAGAALSFAGGDKFKPTVTFAKSWEKAVEEGKALNLPLVVHSHGFY